MQIQQRPSLIIMEEEKLWVNPSWDTLTIWYKHLKKACPIFFLSWLFIFFMSLHV